MITINRDETKVVVEIEGGPLNYKYIFTHECNSKFYAELLRRHFDKALDDRIEAVRREEYERGYKAGKQRQGKASWFFNSLITGKY